MKVLIVEDEALIAQRIERFTKEIYGHQLSRLSIKSTVESAFHHIHQYPIDLLILDLNLNGKDGFQLLQEMVAESFQTVVLSAYIEKAIQAFDYGVLDFVPKPFSKNRLQKAFDRYSKQTSRSELPAKYLAVKKKQRLDLIDIEDISYIKGAGNYAQLILKNRQAYLHDKSLHSLEKLLPMHFERLHKSYIINLKEIISITSQYEIVLNDNTKLPISRSKFKQMKDRIG